MRKLIYSELSNPAFLLLLISVLVTLSGIIYGMSVEQLELQNNLGINKIAK